MVVLNSAALLSRALFNADEKKKYFFKFNVEGLLRGDYQSRMHRYATARQNGWMSANDIRELENLDRIPAEDGGDLFLVNGNVLPLSMSEAAYRSVSDHQTDEETNDSIDTDKQKRTQIGKSGSA